MAPTVSGARGQADIHSPFVANDEPLRLECSHFLALVRGEGDRFAPAEDGLAVVRTLAELQSSLETAPVA